jgi:SP family sugar:H+ symporter-like MFS transporter
VAIEHAKEMTEGTWLDLFRGTNLRRTMVATWLFIFQQWNGQQFVNAYGPTFYVQMGLGSMAFVLDKIGRRRQLMGGIAVSTIFMLLVAILGSRPSPTKAQINMVVASIILFRGFSGISLNACSCESCSVALPDSRQLTDISSHLLRWLSMSISIHSHYRG